MSEGKRLESELFSLLYEQGAGLAGAGDLTGLVEGKMNIGISVAIPVPKHIVRDLQTALTRSGLGWIGKNCFLVTEKYGCAVCLSSLCTNAPLPVAVPINSGRCGGCRI